MSQNEHLATTKWTLWHKVIFRFLFILLLAYNGPWTWGDYLLMADNWQDYNIFHQFSQWLTQIVNSNILHFRGVDDGGGEVYFPSWVTLFSYLLLSVIGCIVWSVIDYKRNNYIKLEYWLRTLVRYALCLTAFSYGIEKMFLMQMQPPTATDLATPLGFFTPFKLTWVYIGSSAPYQFFTGAVEVLAGMLLLFKRTSLLGLLLALGVFVNVMVLNYSYDISVKIFSTQLVFYCLYILSFEWKKLYAFFIQNKLFIAPTYIPVYTKKWEKAAYYTIKIIFFILAVPLITYDIWNYKNEEKGIPKDIEFNGRYDVTHFILNNDSITPYFDKTRWNDIIFDELQEVSIFTFDSTFHYYAGRARFIYETDTVEKTINFLDVYNDSIVICSFNYLKPDTNRIILTGTRGEDSLFIELKKLRPMYPLSQSNFSWDSD